MPLPANNFQHNNDESMPKQATLLDINHFPATVMMRAGLTWATSVQGSRLDPLVVLVPPHQLLQTCPPHALLTPQSMQSLKDGVQISSSSVISQGCLLPIRADKS